MTDPAPYPKPDPQQVQKIKDGIGKLLMPPIQEYLDGTKRTSSLGEYIPIAKAKVMFAIMDCWQMGQLSEAQVEDLLRKTGHIFHDLSLQAANQQEQLDQFFKVECAHLFDLLGPAWNERWEV